jgi:hypothetical protein
VPGPTVTVTEAATPVHTPLPGDSQGGRVGAGGRRADGADFRGDLRFGGRCWSAATPSRETVRPPLIILARITLRGPGGPRAHVSPDLAVVGRQLEAGELACDACRGRLRPGWARERVVRFRDRDERVRPRRSRCPRWRADPSGVRRPASGSSSGRRCRCSSCPCSASRSCSSPTWESRGLKSYAASPRRGTGPQPPGHPVCDQARLTGWGRPRGPRRCSPPAPA